MSLLKKYLEERQGVDSLMRLQSLMTLIFAFIIIIWQMIEGEIYFDLTALLITAGFAPKALQKFAEALLYRQNVNNNVKETKHE